MPFQFSTKRMADGWIRAGNVNKSNTVTSVLSQIPEVTNLSRPDPGGQHTAVPPPDVGPVQTHIVSDDQSGGRLVFDAIYCSDHTTPATEVAENDAMQILLSLSRHQ
jgi:hypothetical protein